MKKKDRKILILASIASVILIGLFWYLDDRAKKADDFVSERAGIYKEPFTVFLKVKKGKKVYYTLDGSTPSRSNGILYDHDKGIEISDDLKIEASISYISTTLDSFPVYKYPWKKPIQVPTAVILRCKVSGKNKIHHYTYIFDKEEERNALPVVSLWMDEKDLFDYEKGIYIPGVNLDSIKLESTGNYFERGKKWERKGYIEYLDPNEKGYSSTCGVRVHGYRSPVSPQKSIKFYGRNSYGKKEFKYPFFDNSEQAQNEYRRLILRSQYSGWGQSLFANSMVQKACKDLNFETLGNQTVLSYINGEFWGLAELIEKEDFYYFQNRFDISKEDFVMVDGRGSKLTDINGKYKDLLLEMEETDYSIEKNYTKLGKEIDINSFMDWMIAETFFTNKDWPGNNYQLWKDKRDGKWRNILTDLDACMLKYKGTNMLKIAYFGIGKNEKRNKKTTQLFRSLLQNESFRNSFYKRYLEVLDDEFSEDELMDLFEEYKALYTPYMKMNIERWNYPPTMDDYELRLYYIWEFIKNRREHAILELNAFYEEVLDMPMVE